MKFKYEIKSSYLYSAALLLLTTGVAMMLAFWYRWYYAAPALLLLTMAVCHGCRQIFRLLKDDRPVEIDIRGLIVLAILPLWMLGAGMGGFWGQHWWDDGHRNAVVYELVNNPWPVTATYYGKDVYMCYYFSFWLPPAAIGKLFGSMRAAYYALFIQEYIYLALMTLMVMHYCGRRYLIVGLILFFFMPPTRINGLIFREWLQWYEFDYTIEINDPRIFASPSVLTNCIHTYNQSLPAMLAMPMMMKTKGHVGLVALLAAMTFIYGPMCAIPLIPVIIYLVIRKPRCFRSIELWAGAVISLLITLFFAGSGNGAHWKPVWDNEHEFSIMQVVAMYFAYIVVSLGLLLPFIWRRVRHNTSFFILAASTLLWIWVMPGYDNYDFSWKGPTLLIFYYNMEICRLCARIDYRRHWLKCTLLGVLLVIGHLSNARMTETKYRLRSRLIPKYKIEREYRPEWMYGKLLDKQFNIPCFHNFAAERPTLYSRYFMPSQRAE